jgi:hypothetical protein
MELLLLQFCLAGRIVPPLLSLSVLAVAFQHG